MSLSYAPEFGAHGPDASVRLVELLVGQPVVVRFLGPVQGLLTHWGGKRSIYCPGDAQKGCQRHRDPVVWKGYAPVRYYVPSDGLWWAKVIEVTENLFNEYLRGKELRGQEWEIERYCEKGKRVPVRGRLLQELDPDTLPKAHSMERCLKSLFRVQYIGQSIPCPYEPKLIVEPVDMSPPANLAAPEILKPPQKLPSLREELDKRRRNGTGN